MRKIKPRSFANTIVVIVDGETEKWYFEKVKEHYPKKCLREMMVKPELAKERKRVDELFGLAEDKVKMGYSQTILVLDMDTILKDKGELQKFRTYYRNYFNTKNGTLAGKRYGWMKNMLLIINTPCLEFWFLLHFRNTNKFYRDFDELKYDLKKIPELQDYEKSEEYFKRHPDIYLRLNSEAGIQTASKNAHVFSLENEQQGVSEMNRVFDLFDGL